MLNQIRNQLVFLKDIFLIYEKETSEKPKEIYSSRESSDSTGGLGFGRTRKINSRVISKNPPAPETKFRGGVSPAPSFALMLEK